MNNLNRTKHFFIAAIVAAVLLGGAGISYIVFTTKGSDCIVRPIVLEYIEADGFSVKETTGNLAGTLVYQDVEFLDLKGLPKGSSLKVQRSEISFDPFSSKGLNVKIRNGTLRFSGSEAILFYGGYQNGILDIDIYSKNISVRDILDLCTGAWALKKISGALSDVDINIKGSLFEPEIYGGFHVTKLSSNGFSMNDCPVEMKIQLKGIGSAPKLSGNVLLKSGTVSGPKTAIVNIKESSIIFEGKPERPALDLKGEAAVEGTKINIVSKGTFDQPKIRLTSVPAMDQDRLLLMLATNKTWQSVETAVIGQELSADIAKDFLDYFIFSGSGSKMAEKYGIRDISVKHNETSTGIGATKDITQQAAVSYAVEQTQQKGEDAVIGHKIGGEYKITDNISVSAEKDLKQKTETSENGDKQQADDKVMLKFKQDF
ncbi:MAG: translocation/assembly module TamB domain-containing protein [Candidatus Omnitrophota bacterium]|nr:translocation/assembly module TamB [Candidatus Omnitrophota bacterium]